MSILWLTLSFIVYVFIYKEEIENMKKSGIGTTDEKIGRLLKVETLRGTSAMIHIFHLHVFSSLVFFGFVLCLHQTLCHMGYFNSLLRISLLFFFVFFSLFFFPVSLLHYILFTHLIFINGLSTSKEQR